ncbi:MAG: phospholipase [Planctomycetes bacterium]|nr:phospholipase [Planctomycetota bacterium]
MEEHRLEVARTARVLVAGDLRGAREVWIVVHGYAQSADEMLAQCAPLGRAERALVAPEALSRFYRRGSSGPVGASWTTREHRELEIGDTTAYLERVAHWIHGQAASAPLQLSLLGFSQGAATVWRWATLGATRFAQIVGCGGGFPPDLDWASATEKLARTRLATIHGVHDRYHTAEWVARDVAAARAAGIGLEVREFEGRHELPADVLASL